MAKLTVTLSLAPHEAEALLETLKIGSDHRFAHSLRQQSEEIRIYVDTRINAAYLSRAKAKDKARKAGKR